VIYRLLARHGWRKVAPDTRHPKSKPEVQEAWKKTPGRTATLLTPEIVRGRRVRSMFKDEARFGRMVRIRRCWAPAPQRPLVDNGYAREFTYVYGAVSPLEGQLDWMICRKMNTELMGQFLSQVSAAPPDDFIVMIIDGASSHVAKALVIPENICLHRLPAYSPQLNPQEHTRNISGTSCERRDFPTGCSPTWPEYCASWSKACRDSPPTSPESVVSPPGRG
jgi:hypothetical protein